MPANSTSTHLVNRGAFHGFARAALAPDTLSLGYSGPKVQKLQELLKAKGFYRGEPNGVFDRATQDAVKDYQASLGLSADGKVTKELFKALLKGDDAADPTSPTVARRQPSEVPTAPTSTARGYAPGYSGASSFTPAPMMAGYPDLSGGVNPFVDALAQDNLPSFGGNTTAYNAAKSLLNRNICDLKNSGPLARYLDGGVPNNVCCANFVSACLEAAHQIDHSERSNNVAGLANHLSQDPKWQKVSLSDAKPGDVVCFNVPGEGPMSHVEMFSGFKNGQPVYIGSNNDNPDGSQRITEGSNGYPVAAVYHYHG